MPPLVDDALLQANPDFSALYVSLTGSILNPDGSTRAEPDLKAREAVRQKLKKHRLQAGRQLVLADVLCSLTPPPSDAQLHDLILLLPSILRPDTCSRLPPDRLGLLLAHPPLADVASRVAVLAELASPALVSRAADLTRLASPSTNPSFLHRAIPSLTAHADWLSGGLAAAQLELGAERGRAAAEAAALLRLHARALAQLVRALEGKHGITARSLELRAGEAALAARLAEAAAGGGALPRARREIYGAPGVEAALDAYAAHLGRETDRERERIRRLAVRLEEHGVGVEGASARERAGREMGRVYRQMGDEIEAARRDLERLERGGR